MTERLHFHFLLSCIGEGNGNPLQYSCLENPRDGGAWWAAVYGVAQSQTRLKRLSSSRSYYSSPSRKYHEMGNREHVYYSQASNLPSVYLVTDISCHTSICHTRLSHLLSFCPYTSQMHTHIHTVSSLVLSFVNQ